MASTIEVRRKNTKDVFQVIYDRGSISKQEIANILALSLPTVTQSLNMLKENHLIYESGILNSTGGRRAKALSCDVNARTAIGLDITGRHLSGAVVNLKGEVLYSERNAKQFCQDTSYYRELNEMAIRCIEKSHVDRDSILGIGISLPGIVSEGYRINKSAIIDNPNFYEELKGFFDLPYILVNDANAGGLAEFWYFKQSSNMLYISLRNTVGGALFFHDELYNGDQYLSGEIGHVSLIMNGRKCYCGRHGCADAYCNAAILSDLTDGDLALFFQKLENDDQAMKKAWDDYLPYLAELINNLRNTLDCDIVIGGYVGSFIDRHMDELRREVLKRSSFQTDGAFVRPCRFKFDASAVGAGLSLIQNFIREI